MRYQIAHAPARATTRQRLIPTLSSLSAAVGLALYGLPVPVAAQPAVPAQQAPASDALQEITVTATRREVALEAVPYSLSVVTTDDIERSGRHGSGLVGQKHSRALDVPTSARD